MSSSSTHSNNNNNVLQKQIFVVVGVATFVYCVYEIYMAMKLHSLTLLSDGFHNLSDVISLVVAWFAVRYSSNKPSDRFTYGFGRAETLGGMINGSCLLALCLYVALESLSRLSDALNSSTVHHQLPGCKSTERTGESQFAGTSFITVSIIGLVMNTLGTLAFACVGLQHHHGHSHSVGEATGHGHGHGHEDHDHGYHSHSVDVVQGAADTLPLLGSGPSGASNQPEQPSTVPAGVTSVAIVQSLDSARVSHHAGGSSAVRSRSSEWRRAAARATRGHGCLSCDCGSANLTGVFLHYLGDTLSSLLVLIIGLVLHYNPQAAQNGGAVYADSIGSLLIVLLVLVTTVPLVRQVSMVFMQTVPRSVSMGPLRSALLAVPNVADIRALHVWELTSGQVHATVELVLDTKHGAPHPPPTFTVVANRVVNVFHHHGINHPVVGLAL